MRAACSWVVVPLACAGSVKHWSCHSGKPVDLVENAVTIRHATAAPPGIGDGNLTKMPEKSPLAGERLQE
jgi:hypothetical protein